MNSVLRKKVQDPKIIDCLNKSLTGFSLIEILVVLAIIGILSGIILTGLTTGRHRARDAAFKETTSSIVAAAVICCNSSGSPFLNAAEPNTGNIDICGDPDINSRYPGDTQVKSVSVNNDCLNSTFSITIFPGTLNSGTCNHADCTEEGCTYDGC